MLVTHEFVPSNNDEEANHVGEKGAGNAGDRDARTTHKH